MTIPPSQRRLREEKAGVGPRRGHTLVPVVLRQTDRQTTRHRVRNQSPSHHGGLPSGAPLGRGGGGGATPSGRPQRGPTWSPTAQRRGRGLCPCGVRPQVGQRGPAPPLSAPPLSAGRCCCCSSPTSLCGWRQAGRLQGALSGPKCWRNRDNETRALAKGPGFPAAPRVSGHLLRGARPPLWLTPALRSANRLLRPRRRISRSNPHERRGAKVVSLRPVPQSSKCPWSPSLRLSHWCSSCVERIGFFSLVPGAS